MIKKSLSSGCPRNSIIFILWITFFIFILFYRFIRHSHYFGKVRG